MLLAFGADPALRDNKGNSGLHVAAALGASACLQLLAGNTKHKEDLNELNDCGKSRAMNQKSADLDYHFKLKVDT